MTTTLTKRQLTQGPRYSQLRRFFWTARKRHKIYERRLAKEDLPWTDDPIFQTYRFCNVYRELDRVTVWLRERWREPHADHPHLPFAMALARLINWPPTLEEIGFPERWDPKATVRAMQRRKAAGEKVYTAAYLLGAIPAGADKAEYLVDDVLTPIFCKLIIEQLPDTLEETWQWFREQRGIGDFLAYEIVTDLRHTKYLCNAPDIMTWANAGPGALRGLTRLYGYQPRVGKSREGYVFPKDLAVPAMQYLLGQSRVRIPDTMPMWGMREVEHWLCEFDKYERVRLGQGSLDKFVPMSPEQWTR